MCVYFNIYTISVVALGELSVTSTVKGIPVLDFQDSNLFIISRLLRIFYIIPEETVGRLFINITITLHIEKTHRFAVNANSDVIFVVSNIYIILKAN